MTGYHGYSMSNNAVTAYENGEKPWSKWTKSELITIISEQVMMDYNFNPFEILKKARLEDIKKYCLIKTSYHHTSIYYNKTDFYSVKADITPEMLINIPVGVKREKPSKTEDRYCCEYLTWSGTRAHPKPTEHIENGVIKGNWFYSDSGLKKSINANGFRIIKKL